MFLFPKNLRFLRLQANIFRDTLFYVRILLPSKKAPHIGATLLWQGRRDCVASLAFSCFCGNAKTSIFGKTCSFSQKIFAFCVCKRIFFGIPCFMFESCSQAKKRRTKVQRFCGRGDAIRTRNRRFWRPLLYR